MTIEEALVLLYDLKRDKKDSYERPHKPVLGLRAELSTPPGSPAKYQPEGGL
jgi:hypothetical protein